MAWIIVGLGNPGKEHEKTPHNAGRMMVEAFAKKIGAEEWKFDKAANAQVAKISVEGSNVICVLPDTFMNLSGKSVLKFVKNVKSAEKMLVVYDDLDLPLGKIKMSFDRGSGGHKGVESITRAVKTKKFPRLRIGVSPHTVGGKIRKPEAGDEVIDFILGSFKPGQYDELKKETKLIVDAITMTVTEGYLIAMNKHNQ